MLAHNPMCLWVSCGALGVVSAGVILMNIGEKAAVVGPVKCVDEVGKV